MPDGRPLLTALFPLRCPGCGATGDAACDACTARCRPPNPASPPRGVEAWAAPFAYEGVARELIAWVKYRNVRAAVPWLTPYLVASAQPLLATVRGPIVVSWPPTTPTRRRTRGFDQAELLARAVARATGLPCRALLRRRPGPAQTGLPAARRHTGPRLTALPAAASILRRHGRAVLLVDDVATTGGTLAAAAAALHATGADRVLALTAARTPAPTATPDRGDRPRH